MGLSSYSEQLFCCVQVYDTDFWTVLQVFSTVHTWNIYFSVQNDLYCAVHR